MSAYEWEHGIGPVKDRPVKNNIAWGGLEPNFLGTAEFLEFCEIAGVEPIINVAYNNNGHGPETTPEEAGDWVEYVNGSTSTPMGQLRAQHGYPEPWNVALWQVGNESYGGYQPGFPGPGDAGRRTFADDMRQYSDAMKAADPDITLIAAGIDPLYRDFGGNKWNRVLLNRAGDKIDAIDIHRYVRGAPNNNFRNNNWNEADYLQSLVTFPTQFEDILLILRGAASQRGYPNMLIQVGEWNLGGIVSDGWERPDYRKMANAAFVAGMYNTFLRQGDAVRFTHQRDNTLYYRPYAIDFRPINPGNFTFELYAELFGNDTDRWHHLPLDVDGPTFFMKGVGFRQQDTPDVPYVDVTGLASEMKDRVVVFAVNRDLQNARTVSLELSRAWHTKGQVEVVTQTGQGPFVPEPRSSDWIGWLTPDAFSLETSSARPDDDGRIELEMPPASVARLTYRVGGNPPMVENKRPVLHLAFDDADAPLQDRSQYESTVSGHGAPTFTGDAAIGDQAVYLDGASYLEVVGEAVASRQFTLDFWFKPEQVQGATWIANKYGQSNGADFFHRPNYGVIVHNDAGVVGGVSWDTGDNNKRVVDKKETGGNPTGAHQRSGDEPGEAKLEAGTWYNAVFVSTADSQSFQLRDTNGEVLGEGGYRIKDVIVKNENQPLRIGKAGAVGDIPPRFFQGWIDDLQVYDFARLDEYGHYVPPKRPAVRVRDKKGPKKAVATVNVSELTATPGAGATVLKWQADAHSAEMLFEVRHQKPGPDAAWQVVGTVAGAQSGSYSYRAEDLELGTHRFQVQAVGPLGGAASAEEVEVTVALDRPVLLAPVFPNPVRGDATLQFALRKAGPARIELYNELGQRVRILYDGMLTANQRHEVTLDGSGLSNGLYIVRMMIDGATATQPFVVMQ